MEPTTSTGAITQLARLAKVIHRRTSDDLLGMRWRHFVILSYLTGRDGVGVPQQEIGEAFCIDPNNLVILLNELESLDFVRRRRDPEDRRRHIVELTEAGHAAFRHAEVARETIEDEVLGALDAEERETLRRLVSKALADSP